MSVWNGGGVGGGDGDAIGVSAKFTNLLAAYVCLADHD